MTKQNEITGRCNSTAPNTPTIPRAVPRERGCWNCRKEMTCNMVNCEWEPNRNVAVVMADTDPLVIH